MARTFEATFVLGGKQAVRVMSFSERHALGIPAEASVEFALDECLDVQDLVGQRAALELACESGSPRLFVGVVESASIAATSSAGQTVRTFAYAARIVSLARLLDRSRRTRIFQSQDVRGIVSAVLAIEGIPAGQQEWKLAARYAKRDYCVQYQETNLAFISRLLEHDGISFGSRFDPDKGEILVFADDSTAAPAIDGDARVPFRRRSHMHVDYDHVHAIGEHRRVVSDKFVLRDFNFEKPMLDMTCEAADEGGDSLEVYDYPGGYVEKADGMRLAKTRLEAELATRQTVSIEGECLRISVGHKLTVTDSGNLDADGEYFIIGAIHEYRDRSGTEAATYVVRAELVPGNARYRPPRRTARPVIEGPQTARIVGPAGSRPEEIHTDPYGRVKVKFHWDLAPDEDDKATFWMRTTQLQTSGSMILPRLDWEVIVEFLEGDPDRPIVSGRLYNGQFMPPYALPEGKTRTAIRSVSTPGGGGANEIRLEDKSGAEEIMIHSQYDTNIAVAHSKTKNVGNCETQFVGVSSTVQVGNNQTIKITKGSQSQVGGNQTVRVGGNRSVGVNAVRTLNVTGSSTTDVGGNQMEMVGNPLEAILSLAVERATEAAATQANLAAQQVEGAVQGKIDQAMGPITALTNEAQALGTAMRAVAEGDVGAVGGLIAGAGALPTAAGLGACLAGGGPPAASAGADQADAPAASDGVSAMLSAAAGSAIQQGVAATRSALGSALGGGAAGGGGESMANAGGPSGAVRAVDETDRTKGPGHTTAKVAGTFTETVGTAKVTAAVNGIITNVAGDVNRRVGAAHLTMTYGNIDETVAGTKDEKALGLVVVAKGNESEAVSGPRTAMVGGAVFDLIKGSHVVGAEAAATFVGALHKIEAQSSITFKCGGSSITLDGSAVTMKSPSIMLLGAKQQLTKAVAESG
ncbi:MAG: type VI secretion system tip protein TssI/VgrG [Polyangiaceae bacterium]|jgi:type VI secretion system secreted protein VgrG